MDHLLTLAFSIYSNKGAYALLLGSGVSRSASIPTGWEVTINLIRQVAQLTGADCEPDPAAWYVKTFGKQPDYSELLNTLAPTPTQRQQLMRGFFEPTKEESEQGLKRPTAAHKAIARLMRDGYVRVVITTNFDRLLEEALAEVGAPPANVIATPDAVDGALPLSHPGNYIVKIHGDYLDTRIKNTVEELEGYDPRLDRLLDRILDEFGMITCGWSADWDIALKAAFERCNCRRFNTYWTHMSPVRGAAQDLVQLRGASTIQIAGADNFFISLEEKVRALADANRPHPLSVQAAIATVKRYIVDDGQRVRLADLFAQEAECLYGEITGGAFPVQANDVANAVVDQIKRFDAVSDMLAAMMIVGCYWGSEQHHRLWVRVLERIANTQPSGGGLVALFNLRFYPALRLAYASSIAALAAERYDTLFAVLARPMVSNNRLGQVHLPYETYPQKIVEYDHRHFLTPLFDGNGRVAPVSDHLAANLRPLFKDLMPRDEEFDYYFDAVEYLWALTHVAYRENTAWYWVPQGRLLWRWSQATERGGAVLALTEELEQKGAEWPLLKAGLFGGSLEKLKEAKGEMDRFITEAAARHY